ncbi:MAG: EamA family transporter [Acidobacteria bacterium]|nr:EamA family transporter [Acidobacteriota bacterium]
MTEAQRRQRFAIILCFGLVYFFWGSTYLGINIAVEHIPPALLCGTRFLASGAIMLFYCRLSRRRILYSWRQLACMAAVGILLLMGSNLTLSYAEKYVPSGLSALIVAITPLWFLVLDSWLLGGHHISPRAKLGLSLGIVGLFVLLWPQLLHTGSLGRAQFWSSVSLIFASFTWALGSVLAKRWKSPDVDPFSAMGWQMTAAGVSNMIFAIVGRDYTRVIWTPRGIAAVVYLVTCGSLVGYTAYIWLLGHVSTPKVSTYAYVNPVVAVFLGWLILHEKIDRFILAGTAIVVASVVLVTSAQVKARAPEPLSVEG